MFPPECILNFPRPKDPDGTTSLYPRRLYLTEGKEMAPKAWKKILETSLNILDFPS